MNQDPAEYSEKIIKEIFENLKIENQFYSIMLKQPVLLIGEKNLFNAIKEAVENNKH